MAIEHGPVEMVDLPIQNGGSLHFVMQTFTRGYVIYSAYITNYDRFAMIHYKIHICTTIIYYHYDSDHHSI